MKFSGLVFVFGWNYLLDRIFTSLLVLTYFICLSFAPFVSPLESVDHLAVLHALLGGLLEPEDLLLRGLEQESDPVGVVVHREVSDPGAGVSVDNNLGGDKSINCCKRGQFYQ